MKKERLKYFDIKAPYIHEDGTYEDLCDVLETYDDIDPFSLKRIAKELGDYINFCLEHSKEYWSHDREAYIHIPREEESVDFEDKKLILDGKYREELGRRVIHIDDDVENEKLQKLLHMSKDADRFLMNPDEEDRWIEDVFGRSGYTYLLIRMIEGKFYM